MRIPAFLIALVATAAAAAAFDPQTEDPNWPGFIPNPFATKNSIIVNLQLDSNPDEVTWAFEELLVDQVRQNVSYEVLELTQTKKEDAFTLHQFLAFEQTIAAQDPAQEGDDLSIVLSASETPGGSNGDGLMGSVSGVDASTVEAWGGGFTGDQPFFESHIYSGLKPSTNYRFTISDDNGFCCGANGNGWITLTTPSGIIYRLTGDRVSGEPSIVMLLVDAKGNVTVQQTLESVPEEPVPVESPEVVKIFERTYTPANTTEVRLRLKFLKGTIPTEVGYLTALTSLHLERNSFNGTIPSEIARLTNLEYLNLGNNKLVGTIPAEIGTKLSNLRYLDLSLNLFQGSIPASLGSLTSLTGLNLKNNQLTQFIPTELGGLVVLEQLDLSHNDLKGPISWKLVKHWALLQVMNLQDNDLTGRIPDAVVQLYALQDFSVESNNLNGTIPGGLTQLVNLTNLDLAKNLLQGTIPNFSRNTKLQKLHLSYNFLDGTIPEHITTLPDIQRLELDNNHLTGTLAPELGDMSTMQGLSLSRNQLHGPIPPELGGMTDLVFLHLDRNQFTGTIPTELAQSSRMQDFFVHDNALTGSVPDALCDLQRNNEFILESIKIDCCEISCGCACRDWESFFCGQVGSCEATRYL